MAEALRFSHLHAGYGPTVVLEDVESPEAGVRTAHEIMAQLGVTPAQLVEGAYVDLLARLDAPPAR